MSTEAQRANLARIRDNQRRSRARRREHLATLEQRLRLCERQGVEASAEVQVAARRVAEENRRLRELLHKQGVHDDYITHYLQSAATASSHEPGNLPSLSTTGQSAAVQALQHTLHPRRPVGLEAEVPFPVPGLNPTILNPPSRETSSTSASTTTTPSVWDASPTLSHYGHGPHIGASSSMSIPQGHHPYPSATFSDASGPRADAYQQHSHHGHQQQAPVADDQNQPYSAHAIPSSGPGMNYNMPMNFYNATPTSRGYEPRSTA